MTKIENTLSGRNVLSTYPSDRGMKPIREGRVEAATGRVEHMETEYLPLSLSSSRSSTKWCFLSFSVKKHTKIRKP